MNHNPKLHDLLSSIALILLPLIGAAYSLLDLPGENVVVTAVFTAILVLGVFLLNTTSNAKGTGFDGEMAVYKAGERTVFQMGFNDEDQLNDLVNKDEVRFKVTHPDEGKEGVNA